MNHLVRWTVAAAAATLLPSAALADDLEGRVEAIDRGARSLVVQGIEFRTMPDTDYDDGLDGFEDLAVGQEVEVDFEYRDGRHFVDEIERED